MLLVLHHLIFYLFVSFRRLFLQSCIDFFTLLHCDFASKGLVKKGVVLVSMTTGKLERWQIRTIRKRDKNPMSFFTVISLLIKMCLYRIELFSLGQQVNWSSTGNYKVAKGSTFCHCHHRNVSFHSSTLVCSIHTYSFCLRIKRFSTSSCPLWWTQQ